MEGAMLTDACARLERAIEAAQMGDYEFAIGILQDLLVDLGKCAAEHRERA